MMIPIFRIPSSFGGAGAKRPPRKAAKTTTTTTTTTATATHKPLPFGAGVGAGSEEDDCSSIVTPGHMWGHGFKRSGVPCVPLGFGAVFEPANKNDHGRQRPRANMVLPGRSTQVARGERSGMRRIRRLGGRTRRRTRTALASHEVAHPDAPTRPPRKTRCTNRGETTRTRSATRAPQPGTGGRHPEKRRARWSLLRGPLRGLMRPGLFIPCQDADAGLFGEPLSNIPIPPERGVDELEKILTSQVLSMIQSAEGRT